MSYGLPNDIERFVDRCMPSLGHLEALLLLMREPSRTFTADQVGKALYIAADVAGSQMADLAGFRFLIFDATAKSYRYGPADPANDVLIRELARLYQERRVSVISKIYSKPVNNVQTFADAFRLRKEP